MNIKMFKSLQIRKVRPVPTRTEDTVKNTAGDNRAKAKIIPLYKTTVVRSRPGKVIPMFF